MGTYIVKVPVDGKDWYLEWSTVVDAPVIYGMSLEEFKKYYKEEYGRAAFEDGEFDRRMKQVEINGTSSMIGHTLDDLLATYKGGQTITRDDFIKKYIHCSNDDK